MCYQDLDACVRSSATMTKTTGCSVFPAAACHLYTEVSSGTRTAFCFTEIADCEQWSSFVSADADYRDVSGCFVLVANQTLVDKARSTLAERIAAQEAEARAAEAAENARWYCTSSNVRSQDSACWRGQAVCEAGRARLGEFIFDECKPVKRAACYRYWKKLQQEWTLQCRTSFAECEESRAFSLKDKRDTGKVGPCKAEE
jgi:hypothetical protein